MTEFFIHLSILLLIVGISLDPRRIKDIGKISLVTGIGQVIFTAFIGFFISKALGFSTIASVYISLAPSEFGATITAKIKPLRDFFIALFFINLGIGMSFTLINQLLLPIIIFTLFIIVGNPLIVFFLMVLFGYRSRTSFLTGLTVAQISEFSLILAAFGFTLGHLSQEAVVLITTVGIITITASTYLITYGNTLYTFFQRPLKLFERRCRGCFH